MLGVQEQVIAEVQRHVSDLRVTTDFPEGRCWIRRRRSAYRHELRSLFNRQADYGALHRDYPYYKEEPTRAAKVFGSHAPA